MIRKTIFALFAFPAVIVGLYPVIYFVLEPTFGLLATKEAALLADRVWNTAFYTHIIFGGIALLIGWANFLTKIRINKPLIHRTLGRIYVGAVVLSAISGIYIGFFATGGIIASLGFISLGFVWLFITIGAVHAVRKGYFTGHQKLMVFSYAACFAAVTLRIWLPLLSVVFQDFRVAYRITARICWVPNMLVGFYIHSKNQMQNISQQQDKLDYQNRGNSIALPIIILIPTY